MTHYLAHRLQGFLRLSPLLQLLVRFPITATVGGFSSGYAAHFAKEKLHFEFNTLLEQTASVGTTGLFYTIRRYVYVIA